MKEDFVPFEIAMKLKEKGFRYNTSYWYNQYGTLLDKDENDRKCKNSVLTNDKSYGVDAPTIAQVLKWLRKENAIHIDVVLWNKGWYCDVWLFEYYEEEGEYSAKKPYQSKDYKSYEQAAIAGIEYALDNLI